MLAPATSLRRFMVATGMTAITLTAGTMPADAATAGWRVESAVPAPAGDLGFLFAVHADAPGDAWGAGGFGAPRSGPGSALVDRWNGHAWAQVRLPPTVKNRLGQSVLFAVGSSSARNVWAFGLCGTSGGVGCWVRRSGTAWSAGRLSVRRFGRVYIERVLVFGKRNAWAFGIKLGGRGLHAFAMHFNGAGWRPASPPGAIGVVDASAVSASDIWAVEGTGPLAIRAGKGALIRWSGGHWRTLAVPKALTAHGLDSVTALGDSNIWIGGSTANSKGGRTEAVGHWNGHAWTVTTMKVAASRQKFATTALVRDGRGGLWAAGNRPVGSAATRLWHFSGGRWTLATLAGTTKPVELLGLDQVPGKQSVWGVGVAGTQSALTGVIALAGPVPH